MRPRRRLCFVPGTWQLIALRAALREAGPGSAHLVTFPADFSSDSFADWMEKLASALGPWSAITAFPGLIAPVLPKDDWPYPVSAWAAELRARIGGSGFDELWLPHVYNVEDRLILEAFRHLPVMLYEDGLYLSQPLAQSGGGEMWRLAKVAPRLLLRGELRDHMRSTRLADWRLAPSHAKRIRRVHTFFGPHFGSPHAERGVPSSVISAEVLRKTAAKAADAVGLDVAAGTDRDCLVLGPSFHLLKCITWETEIRAHETMARVLIEKGYRLFWKDHPRELRPFGPELAKVYAPSDFAIAPMPQALPVELLGAKRRFPVCVGGFSASLFYLQKLFGFEPFTCLGSFAGMVTDPSMRALLDLVRSRVPEYTAMPRRSLS